MTGNGKKRNCSITGAQHHLALSDSPAGVLACLPVQGMSLACLEGHVSLIPKKGHDVRLYSHVVLAAPAMGAVTIVALHANRDIEIALVMLIY